MGAKREVFISQVETLYNVHTGLATIVRIQKRLFILAYIDLL